MSDLIVNVAVSEHGVEVLHALAGTAVEIVFQPLLYGAQVHGDFDNLVIVLQEEIRTRGSDWYLITSFQFNLLITLKKITQKKKDRCSTKNRRFQ